MRKIGKNDKMFAIGFLFGTIGLYIVSLASLSWSIFEYALNVFAGPGRSFAGIFFDSEANLAEIVILTVFNGLFYGLVFTILHNVFVGKRHVDTLIPAH